MGRADQAVAPLALERSKLNCDRVWNGGAAAPVERDLRARFFGGAQAFHPGLAPGRSRSTGTPRHKTPSPEHGCTFTDQKAGRDPWRFRKQCGRPLDSAFRIPSSATQIPRTAHTIYTVMMHERQRCSIKQPRVARHELSWVIGLKSEPTLKGVEATALESRRMKPFQGFPNFPLHPG
jgi:hypothetical protein